ncbi:MAG: hypothetical protein K2I36_01180 [Ureaplasma sp.]|nr:hypothetical protein [Ureaplasma sp.]
MKTNFYILLFEIDKKILEEFEYLNKKDITLIDNILQIEKNKNFFIALINSINDIENKANLILKKYINENNEKEKIIDELSEENLRLSNLIDNIKDGKSFEISNLLSNYQDTKNKNDNEITLLNNQIYNNNKKIYILESSKNYKAIIDDINFSLDEIICYLDQIIQNDDYQEIISSLDRDRWIPNSTINQLNNYDLLIKNIINKK